MNPLSRVERAAAKAAVSRAALEAEIRDARKTNSLRAVAEAARMSHESVRHICET